jgi:hypothetical protein
VSAANKPKKNTQRTKRQIKRERERENPNAMGACWFQKIRCLYLSHQVKVSFARKERSWQTIEEVEQVQDLLKTLVTTATLSSAVKTLSWKRQTSHEKNEASCPVP